MPIYTRTGDKGKTSLANGTRVLKSNNRVEAYGTIDELNSAIGIAGAFLSPAKFQRIKKELVQIQNDLFVIGSSLSSPRTTPSPNLKNRPSDFEKLIDSLTSKLPPLKNFILPGGGSAGAHLHICRTISRRAERRVIALIQQEEIDNTIIIYLNRLSDLFFTLARYVNYIEKKKETKWIKR
jgi:cob(I)alamin adenosyltransferase